MTHKPCAPLRLSLNPSIFVKKEKDKDGGSNLFLNGLRDRAEKEELKDKRPYHREEKEKQN